MAEAEIVSAPEELLTVSQGENLEPSKRKFGFGIGWSDVDVWYALMCVRRLMYGRRSMSRRLRRSLRW
ncbi:hypothetical protein CGZ80_01090 [Rhodopirellula sp. MGV]|nr:hypothetical protein CGZ80_01090 [Rhodopirellula sp. MGV]